MAAGVWTIYNEFKKTLGDKLDDLNTDSIKVALFLSTSNAGSATLTTAQYATLTNEHASANGYTTGGVVVAATWVRATGTVTFDTADASWTAAGGSIVARFAVLYDNTATLKHLIAYCLLDATPADVTTLDGNTITIQIANVFTLA